jgi:hypothetical protein
MLPEMMIWNLFFLDLVKLSGKFKVLNLAVKLLEILKRGNPYNTHLLNLKIRIPVRKLISKWIMF